MFLLSVTLQHNTYTFYLMQNIFNVHIYMTPPSLKKKQFRQNLFQTILHSLSIALLSERQWSLSTSRVL